MFVLNITWFGGTYLLCRSTRKIVILKVPVGDMFWWSFKTCQLKYIHFVGSGSLRSLPELPTAIYILYIFFPQVQPLQTEDYHCTRFYCQIRDSSFKLEKFSKALIVKTWLKNAAVWKVFATKYGNSLNCWSILSEKMLMSND